VSAEVGENGQMSVDPRRFQRDEEQAAEAIRHGSWRFLLILRVRDQPMAIAPTQGVGVRKTFHTATFFA